jgi:hypothetical protein
LAAHDITVVRANRVVVRPAAKDQRPRNQTVQEIKDILNRHIHELGLESLDGPLA